MSISRPPSTSEWPTHHGCPIHAQSHRAWAGSNLRTRPLTLTRPNHPHPSRTLLHPTLTNLDQHILFQSRSLAVSPRFIARAAWHTALGSASTRLIPCPC